jgi:L-rhamnose isomerase
MKHVEVGMFRLPGLTFTKEEITPEVLEEMQAWAEAEGVGMSMTETLWSFKKDAHRDWFVLRWSDSLVKPKAEE